MSAALCLSVAHMFAAVYGMHMHAFTYCVRAFRRSCSLVCLHCDQGLYMDAVQLFPGHLQEFVDLMTERELRLRLPLEELDILLED